METEDIIELGSSDEEPGPPPPKKMNVKNAMVHIPSNLRGVTIKPVKANVAQLPKLGKNITITKTPRSPLTLPTSKLKPEKVIQKTAAAKKKPIAKKPDQTIQAKGKVFNPLCQIKKGVLHSVGNSTITRLKNPIQIKKPQTNRPQPLQSLPPSITIKKTATAVKPIANLNMLPRSMPKQPTNVGKKRKIEVVQTVELDDEDTSTSSASPLWYVRPEEQSLTTQQGTPSTQMEPASSQEDANNKEPEGPKYIEITIEDSPIKPAKTKRTRELSTEKVITIDDSPNKVSVISDDIGEGSDSEANTTKKVPQSKKKLNYPNNLQTIEEIHTVEIEIEPLQPINPLQEDTTNPVVNKESKIVSLTPDIMEVEEASVEIAQNKQGGVSIVQIKPAQPKEKPKVASQKDVATKSELKPKIDPKKDVGMKSEFHPIYQSFISLCIQLENSNDMEKIIEKKIKPYYRQAPKEYTESEEFLDMVSSKITAMEAAPEKMYLYIKDIVDELNLQRKYMKQMPVEETKSKDQDSFLYGKENELDPNKQRQIRKLEKTLKKLNRAIQKLEAQEVDFDDEEDSVYLLTEKYKERMVRVHAKFCQLTNTKLPSQPRLVIDPRPGLSAAPAKRLEAWINKKNSVTFPDFHDVLRCVREANEIENLGWNEAFIMEEARDLFVRCGRKLQRRRQENEWRLATSRMTPNSDPAEHSDELKKQLEANRRLASTKETEVFDKFCDRQSQLKLEAEEIDDKEAEESPIESEEEDNDEDSSLESKQKRKERLRRLLQEQSKKNIPNKIPQPEDNTGKAEKCDVESFRTEAKKEFESVNEENVIQSLSDDSNEIGSDMDELHLLQKLHSDSEIRTVSSSSDSETPIAISDTMDSSSDDDEKQTKEPGNDIISIENSSYSDDSETDKSKKIKKDENRTTETNKEAEPSTSTVTPTGHANDDTIENTVITSSEDDSNCDDNTNSGKNDNSSKLSALREGQASLEKDFELSITSGSAELSINANDIAKPSDADDEQSINSDMNDNHGSSTSSGQYEELLKEHNSDPLLKRPELIPRDPSDELYDSIVIKHYNDPLVKKTLKGSDSSNGDDLENSNSDSQSTIAPETIEEVKKDLIETSVDTEEFLNVDSPSLQIVDKLVDKLKQSDGSQSSGELMMKVDQELGLRADVISPVTFALEKEVNVARQTRAWPRFKDECSSVSSAEEVNTSDNSPSMPTKTYDSKNDDVDEIKTTRSELSPISEVKDESCRSESTNLTSDDRYTQNKDITESVCTASKDVSSSCSRSIKETSNEMDAAHIQLNSAKESILNDASSTEYSKEISEEMDNASSEAFYEESKDTDDISSKPTVAVKNDATAECNVADAKKQIEANIDNSSYAPVGEISEAMDISEVETEANDISTFNNKEMETEDLINDIVSLQNTNDTAQTFKDSWNPGNESELLNSNEIPQENSDDAGDTLMSILNSNNEIEDRNSDGTELISNGNLNMNMDISDLLDSNTNIGCDKVDHSNDLQSAEKGDCDEEAVHRPISNTCLQSTEGNNII